MKDRTIELNGKGILLVVIVILTLVFALGFMTSEKRRQEQDPTIFTREDLERIAQLQELEDDSKSGAEICAYKDKDGNLIITYEYNGSKRK